LSARPGGAPRCGLRLGRGVRRGLAVLLAGGLLGCGDPSLRPGRPEFFERITGHAFDLGAAGVECQRGRGVGRAALYRYDLSGEALAWLGDPPPIFRERPVLDGPPEGREVQAWRTGVAREPDEVAMTAQAISSVYWVLAGDCEGAPDFRGTVSQLRASLARETTHLAMITIPQVREVLLMHLYVIDPVAGHLYLVDANP
jgi:hypothetical protein